MSNSVGLHGALIRPKPGRPETLNLGGLASSKEVIQCVNCTWPLGEISHPNQNIAEDFIDY